MHHLKSGPVLDRAQRWVLKSDFKAAKVCAQVSNLASTQDQQIFQNAISIPDSRPIRLRENFLSLGQNHH